jgi:ATP-dependent DNA helicase RecG
MVDLEAKLNELRGLPAELEWFDFKEAKNTFDSEKLGEFFSALSNEANLKGQPCGWLVFGVEDRPPRRIVGTQYKTDRAALDVMKKHVADQTTQRLTFVEIHELHTPEGRVIMFEIPPAPPGVPVAWKGHFYGRDGESIGALNPEEYERIRAPAARRDWSAEVVDDAALDDLDPVAVAFARAEFLKKQPQHADEANRWDDLTFLNKAKVTLSGKITRAALVLLGKPESVLRLLQPAVVEVSWRLNDASGEMRDYKHIDPPLILAGQALLKRIRNLNVRHMPGGSLFPEEVTQYDERVLREALHNCIAHQDYTANARITVVENDDELAFGNRGAFIPGSVEHVIATDAPPDVYRNRFLAQAMVNLNMIDTMGSGIRRMFTVQRKRSFPLPDYDLTDPQRVVVRITGRIIDERYTRLLLKNTDLSLADAIALDKVQRKKPLDDETLNSLKRRKLIEGRGKSVFVAAAIAAATGDEDSYLTNRGVDQQHYRGLVEVFLTKYPGSKRAKLEKALLDKLPAVLTPQQKKNRVRNLLQEMRRDGDIRSTGRGKAATWDWTRRPAGKSDG